MKQSSLALLAPVFFASFQTPSSGVCEPEWQPTSGGGLPVATEGPVHAGVAFDDGTGPALFFGGNFGDGGGQAPTNVAKWDGERWIGAGLSGFGGTVYAMAVFDDGSGNGPELYAGGDSSSIGRIAKWTGDGWEQLGTGVGSQPGHAVRALHVFDDGSGPALYAGGFFTTAGGATANHVARWDGQVWSAVGTGMDSPVNALATFDDGTGAALYAGGEFAAASGSPANFVAKWNGASWSSLGIGTNAPVHALTAHDDGTGSALYAGGEFTTAGAGQANRIARWDGAAWSALAGGIYGTDVLALKSFDDGSGSGSALYVGGTFYQADATSAGNIARWNGVDWSAAGSQYEGPLRTLVSYDAGAGAGAELHAGGAIASKWTGSTWVRLGVGFDHNVLCGVSFDDGTGPALYIGGQFKMFDDTPLLRVAKWDGQNWSPLGGGLNSRVYSLVVFDDGTGPALYAGGMFSMAGGVPADSVAKWDGVSWSPLGSGAQFNGNAVHDLIVHDDGSGGGPALYAAGSFESAAGVAANNIAKWDGAAWSPLGSGLDSSGNALAVFDSGSGPELYVAGSFNTAGGITAWGMAKWNGLVWSEPTGQAISSSLATMTVFDDGTGDALWVGGILSENGTSGVGRWDGQLFTVVAGLPTGVVTTLAGFDDGKGPALYAAQSMAGSLHRLRGGAWSVVEGGPSTGIGMLTPHEAGAGAAPELWVGGAFTTSPNGDAYLSRLRACVIAPGAAYCFGDGFDSVCPCSNYGGVGEGCANSSGAGAVLAGTGTSSVTADDLGFAAKQLLPGQAALLYVGNNSIGGGNGIPFGDGSRCVGGSVKRLGVRIPNAAGAASWSSVGTAGNWSAGDTRRFQVWYRNTVGSPCGAQFNYSNGYRVDFTN